MKLRERFKSWMGIGTGVVHEGAPRGPFYGQGEFGGWHQYDPLGDGWQRALHSPARGNENVSMVYAAVMLYCRAISQCEPLHLVKDKKDSWEPSTTSAASRVLRRPNDYETWTQFVYNIVAGMLFDGESLALKVMDERGELVAFHRVSRGNWSIHIDPETKTVFYGINEAEMYSAPEMLIPAREVVHFRQHCPRHPLIGESPVKAASMAIGITTALSASQLAFFSQMNRASGVLSTDVNLTAVQMKQLRDAFDAQSKLWAQGGMPILGGGLKFQPMNVSQADSQLIEQQRLSAVDIARVFGVPMALLSESSGTQGGTESLIGHWLSIGLGSVIESIERTLDVAFGLGVGSKIELDPRDLLRVDFASRIDGLVKAVQGGVLTPREARIIEGYGEKEGDDDLFLQQQMVSLSTLNRLHEAELAAKLRPPPEPVAAVAVPDKLDDTQDKPQDDGKHVDAEITKALVVSLFDKKRKKSA